MDEEEHGVHAQPEGEERHDLGGGRVEGEAEKGGQSEPGPDIEGDQEDSTESKAGLGADLVTPPVEADHGVQDHERVAEHHIRDAQLGEVVDDVLEAEAGVRVELEFVPVPLVPRD